VNILSMTAHSIEEYDMVRMFTDLGHDVFSPGAYMVPSEPGDDMRPALPDAPHHPDLAAIVNNTTMHHEHGPTWAVKANLPPEFLEWADVVMIHHALEQWLYPQWPKLKASGKRIIWRTVGQSGHENEWVAQPIVRDGLEVVRYSPRESVIPNFAGEDTMIRFYKDPDEYTGWHGSDPRVLVITQNPVERQAHVGTGWMLEVLKDLPHRIIGPQTEVIGGEGKVSPSELIEAMRSARVMLYTGTIPASYTLGLIEAMMTGTPVVAIGPQAWSWAARQQYPYASRLYEGHAIAPLFADNPSEARTMLQELLNDADHAAHVGAIGRERAITLFGKDRVYKAWDDWLMLKRQPEPEPDELPDVATREAV
jgi:glycosyltransferase involved in cell wall biosynthesis